MALNLNSEAVNNCRTFLFLSIFNLPGDNKKQCSAGVQLEIETY